LAAPLALLLPLPGRIEWTRARRRHVTRCGRAALHAPG